MLNLKRFESLYDRFKSSGLRVRDFCINECVSESKFYYWQRKLKEQEREKAIPPDLSLSFLIMPQHP